MDSLITDATTLIISPNTTVEDVLNFTKTEIQNFLRLNNIKISGNKLHLAQRVVDTIQSRCGQTCSELSDCAPVDITSCTDKIPIISELNSGWTGSSAHFPKVGINDIEKYLLHSSHRTEDEGKMQCYRQYIRGLNLFKERYVHKIMINEINDKCKLCYIRSKCYPSMKQGVYEQWMLVTKEGPFQVVKANCTCPAG